MRRTALSVAGVALLALVAVPGVARGAGSPLTPLNLTPADGHYVEIREGLPGQPGRTTWGYWGKLTGGPKPGSYRATCVWLVSNNWSPSTNKRDNRFLCTLVLSFRGGPAGPTPHTADILVALGLARPQPKDDGLFSRPSVRRLAITGGTGKYELARGYVDLQVGNLAVVFV
jgi:hypothetical protein